jgi:hypothetical protein
MVARARLRVLHPLSVSRSERKLAGETIHLVCAIFTVSTTFDLAGLRRRLGCGRRRGLAF